MMTDSDKMKMALMTIRDMAKGNKTVISDSIIEIVTTALEPPRESLAERCHEALNQLIALSASRGAYDIQVLGDIARHTFNKIRDDMNGIVSELYEIASGIRGLTSTSMARERGIRCSEVSNIASKIEALANRYTKGNEV